MTKVRGVEVEGFKVEIHNFGYASFYYPSFNGNAEFEAGRKGFRQLRRYLRAVRWAQSNLSILN